MRAGVGVTAALVSHSLTLAGGSEDSCPVVQHASPCSPSPSRTRWMTEGARNQRRSLLQTPSQEAGTSFHTGARWLCCTEVLYSPPQHYTLCKPCMSRLLPVSVPKVDSPSDPTSCRGSLRGVPLVSQGARVNFGFPINPPTSAHPRLKPSEVMIPPSPGLPPTAMMHILSFLASSDPHLLLDLAPIVLLRVTALFDFPRSLEENKLSF